MQKVCEERFEQFGAAGNAPKIKPVSLAAMAQFYL
jgi:fructose-bisphosphate aldolase class II